MKKALYQLIPALPRLNLFFGRKLQQFRVHRKKGAIGQKLAHQHNIYTNVGCGGCGLATGWVNLDYGKYQNVSYLYDCRKNLPFADNSVAGIFTEHFFEHLDYQTEVPYFLKSCFRVLQESGTLRIVIPDAEKYLKGYVEPNWDLLKATRPLNDELEDQLMAIMYQTKMQLINEVFRQDGQHKYAWDFETLELSLRQASFHKIYKMDYLKTHDPKLALDQLVRQPESLYVEAIK